MAFAGFTSIVFSQHGMKIMFRKQIRSILLVSLLSSSWYMYFNKVVLSLGDSSPRKSTCLYSLRFLRYLKGQLALLQLRSWPAYSSAPICEMGRALWSFFHWKTGGAFHTAVIHLPLPGSTLAVLLLVTLCSALVCLRLENPRNKKRLALQKP